MSISTIAETGAQDAHHGGPPPGIREAVGSMAGVLGMSAEALDATLGSIASSSGRTRTDLLQALARGFTVDDRA
jgi:hypothetical protein